MNKEYIGRRAMYALIIIKRSLLEDNDLAIKVANTGSIVAAHHIDEIMSGIMRMESDLFDCQMKLKSEKEEKIIRDNLIDHLLELSCNINSTHVVQKIVEELKEPKRDYINQFVIMNFLPLCKDVNGICLIKKFISENKEEAITKSILLCLEKDYIEITQDQFGNYAVQHAVDKFGYSKCYNIIRLICKNIVYFANQKFSSNVVDKIVIALHHNSFNEFSQLIQAMFMNNENMFEMLRNKFGMFVLMNSIKLINMEQKFIIRNFLIEKLNAVNNIEDQTLLTRLVKSIQ